MNPNQKQILEILSQGKINVDEAERLLEAIRLADPSVDTFAKRAEAVTERSLPPRAKPKYLRVLVRPESGTGGPKVNIRIPIQLLRAGVRLKGLIPESAQLRVNEALAKNGVHFDINRIKPEDLDALVDQLADLSVEVDDDSNKVQIFCE